MAVPREKGGGSPHGQGVGGDEGVPASGRGEVRGRGGAPARRGRAAAAAWGGAARLPPTPPAPSRASCPSRTSAQPGGVGCAWGVVGGCEAGALGHCHSPPRTRPSLISFFLSSLPCTHLVQLALQLPPRLERAVHVVQRQRRARVLYRVVRLRLDRGAQQVGRQEAQAAVAFQAGGQGHTCACVRGSGASQGGARQVAHTHLRRRERLR